jgi:hypothetical protein
MIIAYNNSGQYRTRASGKPYLTLCYALFIDDFGRARKSTWRPITGQYATLLNAPVPLRRSLTGTRFVSASSANISLTTVWKTARENFAECEQGFVYYSAALDRNVFVDGFLYVLPCDNAMASWFCNHLGATALDYCRKCDARIGTATSIGLTKTHDDILRMMYDPATTGSDLRERGIKAQNLIIWPAVDPLLDTPVDTLHTLYLGLVKHFLADLMSKLTQTQKLKLNSFFFSETALKGAILLTK